MTEIWHVYAWRRGANGREWVQLAWADDLTVAQNLFLQACASTSSTLRLVHDGAGSPDPGFDRSVIAERMAPR